jgi:hypothetical protein
MQTQLHEPNPSPHPPLLSPSPPLLLLLGAWWGVGWVGGMGAARGKPLLGDDTRLVRSPSLASLTLPCAPAPPPLPANPPSSASSPPPPPCNGSQPSPCNGSKPLPSNGPNASNSSRDERPRQSKPLSNTLNPYP